jgi:hypothetical protein
MAKAVESHPNDLLAQARALHHSTMSDLYPWYRSSVEQDAEARRVATSLLNGDDPDRDTNDPRTMMRGVFREGLLPALRLDAVVARAFFRTFNLLGTPDAIAKDPDVGARVFAVWSDRENRGPEPLLGPKTRDELLSLVA